MLIANKPHNEEERLKHLNELDILDTIEEQAYDDLTLLAAQICETPIALISLIDEDRQWFKSHYGINIRETPRNLAFCSHAILGDELFLVEDADQDQRFHDSPLVKNNPKLKFYAGAPLVLENDIRVGTICVIDKQKRRLSDEQKNTLEALARQVVSQFKLRSKIKELKKLDNAKDEFLSMVSHELRTPLTSLKGSLNIMQHLGESANEQKYQMMDVAIRNAEQLLVIVNDILDLAQMEAGSLKIDLAPVNLYQLINCSVELNAAYIQKCECTISINIPNHLENLEVLGDEGRLVQVLSNLLSNAAKFSPKEGNITISLEKNARDAIIKVTDNGVGIPKKFQQYIFGKFRQFGNGNNKKLPGTGLGLNICKHIIDAHNGEIGFTSIPDKETTFYFKLKTQ